jgi:hypothetical protein
VLAVLRADNGGHYTTQTEFLYEKLFQFPHIAEVRVFMLPNVTYPPKSIPITTSPYANRCLQMLIRPEDMPLSGRLAASNKRILLHNNLLFHPTGKLHAGRIDKAPEHVSSPND